MNQPSIQERAKRIITDPKSEWLVIEPEQTTTEKLYREYIALLAAVPVIATLINNVVIGTAVPFVGWTRTPIVQAVVIAIVTYILALVGVYIAAFIVDKLAPTFDSKPDQMQALKLVAYAYTPAWVAGAAYILPLVGVLVALVGGLYSIYVFYLGLPVMMKTPQHKVVAYMVVAAVAIIVVSFVLMMFAALFTGMLAFMY